MLGSEGQHLLKHSSKYLEHTKKQEDFEHRPRSFKIIRIKSVWLGFPNTQEHPISDITLSDFRAYLKHSGVLGTEVKSWVATGTEAQFDLDTR